MRPKTLVLAWWLLIFGMMLFFIASVFGLYFRQTTRLIDLANAALAFWVIIRELAVRQGERRFGDAFIEWRMSKQVRARSEWITKAKKVWDRARS